MEKDEDKNVPHWLLQTKNIILIIIAILTAINTLYTQRIKDDLYVATQEIETKIKQRQFENELRFKIFDEVKTAVTSNQSDTNLQKMVSIIMEEMLQEDTAFREKMVNVLLSSNIGKSVKQDIVKAERFNTDQIAIKANQKDVSSTQPKYIIDVFYLDDVLSEAEPLAGRVKSLLETKYKPEDGYTIRLRLLPRTVNRKIGYMVDDNQVRYESSELALATDIMNTINNTNILDQKKVRMKTVSNRTPNYVSVFIRNR